MLQRDKAHARIGDSLGLTLQCPGFEFTVAVPGSSTATPRPCNRKKLARRSTAGRQEKGMAGGQAMIVRDAAHWRVRAKEARALALKIADPESKMRMLGIADEYEKLAQRAEGEQTSPKPKPP
jgi:hypothetical protein